MNTEDRVRFIYDAMGPCYWCADKDCEHHRDVARKIAERWQDDVDDAWNRAVNEGRAAQ